MRFMLMMHAPRGDGDWAVTNWKPEELRAHIAFMHQLNADLVKSGEFVDAQGLDMPAAAVVVRAGKGGVPMADGVFPESKEFLAGFWVVEVDRKERAFEIAARASTAPGPGGAPLIIPIEVRQVMRVPPVE